MIRLASTHVPYICDPTVTRTITLWEGIIELFPKL
jgi:hypothetical protein